MSATFLLLTTIALLLALAGAFLGGRYWRGNSLSGITRNAASFLRGDENFSQALLDNLSDAVVACDARGRLILFNRAARNWHGLPPSDLPPEQWASHYDIYAADGVTPLAKENLPLLRAFRGEAVRNAQIVIAPVGRPQRFVLCSGDPVLDSNGEKIGAVLVMHDISEQREAGQERLHTLNRVQRQQATILQLANDTRLSEIGLEPSARLITEACAETLDVASSSIWLFSDDRRELRSLDRFERNSRTHANDVVLAIDRHLRYIKALQTSHAIDAFDACIDPRTSEFTDEYFRPRGVGATLDASIRIHGEVVGVVCNEHIGSTRRWTPDEANFVTAIADQVAQCITAQERRRSADTLRDSEQRFRALYDENPAMFFTVDAENHIVSINQFGASQLGYHVPELMGQSFTLVVAESERAAALLRHANCLHSPAASIHRWESRLLCRDGGSLQMRQTARLVHGPDGRPQILYVSEDITETHRLSEKLAYEASHDVLTGLLNRWEFERRLRQTLTEAQDTNRQHALIYIDLDQFKVINENCGHVAGDQLLRQVATLLESQTREQVAERGLLARLGGDEFAVLLRDHTVDQAVQLAELLRKSLSNLRFSWEGKRFRTAASLGVAPVSAGSSDAESVLQAADAACYLAKDRGRDRVHVYQPDDSDLARRRNEIQWAARIRSALEDNRLRLVRHSIAPLKGPAQGAHYELLIRLVDEQGQITRDAQFLTAAEHYGFAPQIDTWVINTAFDWLEHNPEHLRQLHLCCINLSGLSLGQEDFLVFLQNKLREGKVPPEKICFEITETAAVSNLIRATEFMATLKSMGCSFSLDDFGSGLSSYAYLRNLSVDFLKIDGSFVRYIADDPVDLALLRSMNEIGQLLGKKTIAEFAENERVIQKLREVGVDYIQGHGVSRPVPLDAPLDDAPAVASG
jgi:diguanylate cyclase (GGDEF)-like protein/PAS domain S-box-containing protein